MLLTITNHHAPATDLGYLLHKNPSRVQSFELSFGRAHVFYPEVANERCTAVLLLDVDPVGLVRNRRGPAGERGTLAQYVNDRPYVASSFLSVAIAQVFASALGGRSKDKPELVETSIPLTAKIAVLQCRNGENLIRRLFEPLGYQLQIQRHVLDERFPEWGESPYYTVELSSTTRLQDLLTHLYVLIPVLDSEKHYWVGDDELEKLLRHGEGWLAGHPEKEIIVKRYLKYQHSLAREALLRLTEEDQPDPDAAEKTHTNEELAIEAPLKLWEQRLGSVQRERIRLMHGSLMYKDKRLAGFDAACVVEVIEHLDPPRLAAFERVLFENARPKQVVITTPNSEYNVRFPTLPAGQFRHKDHRFEWTRPLFRAWAESITSRFGYSARFLPVGPEDSEVGSPTQMGVFTL